MDQSGPDAARLAVWKTMDAQPTTSGESTPRKRNSIPSVPRCSASFIPISRDSGERIQVL